MQMAVIWNQTRVRTVGSLVLLGNELSHYPAKNWGEKLIRFQTDQERDHKLTIIANKEKIFSQNKTWKGGLEDRQGKDCPIALMAVEKVAVREPTCTGNDVTEEGHNSSSSPAPSSPSPGTNLPLGEQRIIEKSYIVLRK